MAAPPLTTTPTDVMFDIFDLLPMTDLCNFRQTCKWAQHQSFKTFAIRGYKHMVLPDINECVCRFARAMENNSDLAASIKTLSVWGKPQIKHGFSKMRSVGEDDFLSRQTLQSHGEWTVSGVIATLPCLESLKLSGLTRQSFAWHFSRQHVPGSLNHGSDADTLEYTTTGTNWPRLSFLSLRFTNLTSQELTAIYQLVGAEVTNVHLSSIVAVDGKWLEFLHKVPVPFPALKTLRLQILLDGTRSSTKDDAKLFTFQDYGVRLHKALRGANGIEV
ncbi:hypothetical protein LTR17_001624 [Elasticomyces elasticus]|nr:hypothetical protein LTR17_001624 [Elasticomyces elasticus]